MEKTEDIILEEKPSLGKSLSFARIRKELSQKDIADELNLGKDIINAIENDELIEGISPTYVRGYQRSYIRFLELDEAELLGDNAASQEFSGTHDNLQVIDKNMSMRGSGGGFSFPFRFFMPLLLVGLAIIYWPQISAMFSRDSSQTTTQAATVKQETDTEVIQTVEIKPKTIEESIAAVVESAKESDAESQTDKTDTDKVATDTATNTDDDGQVTIERVGFSSDSTEPASESSLTSDKEQENSTEATTEEVEVASVDPQDAQTKITFVSTGETWLDIRDAQDARLFRNNLKLDRITVSGVLPLKIRAGNLQAVRVLSFQGEQKKVDIFDDSTTVANFYIEKDQAGRLKFTTQ